MAGAPPSRRLLRPRPAGFAAAVPAGAVIAQRDAPRDVGGTPAVRSAGALDLSRHLHEPAQRVH